MFVSGGFGGHEGGSFLLQMNKTSTSYLPNINAKAGLTGENGKNAKTCGSYALDVEIHTESTPIPLVSMLTFSSKFNTEKIHSPKCNEEIVNSSRKDPKPSEKLNIAPAIAIYKEYLSRNMDKSNLLESIREMYKTMNEIPDRNHV